MLRFLTYLTNRRSHGEKNETHNYLRIEVILLLGSMRISWYS